MLVLCRSEQSVLVLSCLDPRFRKFRLDCPLLGGQPKHGGYRFTVVVSLPSHACLLLLRFLQVVCSHCWAGCVALLGCAYQIGEQRQP